MLAVDVGGTKTAAALVDDLGIIRQRWRWATDASNPATFVAQVAGLVSDSGKATEEAPLAIGVALPSVLDAAREHVVWSPNLPGWVEVPLAALLQAKTGLPVLLDLDGHLAAVGEHWAGALKGFDDFLCVVVGTGIGAGVFIGGRLQRGLHNLAGCIGWMVVGDTPAVPDRADVVGWLESRAGGTALQDIAPSLGYDAAPSGVEQLVAASKNGDEDATAVLVCAGRLIGRAVANVVNLLGLQVVALGGGLGQASPAFLSEVKSAIYRYAHPYLREDVEVILASTGVDAPMLGAALLAMEVAGVMPTPVRQGVVGA